MGDGFDPGDAHSMSIVLPSDCFESRPEINVKRSHDPDTLCFLRVRHNFWREAAGCEPMARDCWRSLILGGKYAVEGVMNWDNRTGESGFYFQGLDGSPCVIQRVQRTEAGALGFRDFPGLPMTKENRNGSHRTLLSHALVVQTVGVEAV